MRIYAFSREQKSDSLELSRALAECHVWAATESFWSLNIVSFLGFWPRKSDADSETFVSEEVEEGECTDEGEEVEGGKAEDDKVQEVEMEDTLTPDQFDLAKPLLGPTILKMWVFYFESRKAGCWLNTVARGSHCRLEEPSQEDAIPVAVASSLQLPSRDRGMDISEQDTGDTVLGWLASK